MIIFLDSETTNIDLYSAEIIEAYFAVYDDGKIIDEYFLNSKVDNWSDEAQKIHGIDYYKMLSYPDKKQAYNLFLSWAKKYKNPTFGVFANPCTTYGHITYDAAIIKREMFDLYGYNHAIYYKYFNDNHLNVHLLAKKLAKENKFNPIRGKSGRQSFSQVNVYKVLFQEEYDAHNAFDDTQSMIKIYEELKRLENNEQRIFI